jgi:starch phosphorylase
MRESMARLTPRFCATRTVREYTEQHYLPSAAACQARAADKGALAAQIVAWRRELDQKWAAVRFGEVKVETRGGRLVFEVQVWLRDLDPASARVELYADGVNGGASVRQEMNRVGPLAGAQGGHVYSASVPAARPPTDYTARLTPRRDGVAVPLEDPRILWQR